MKDLLSDRIGEALDHRNKSNPKRELGKRESVVANALPRLMGLA
jgi:hypothetical protein